MSLTRETKDRIVDRMLDIWETAGRWTKGTLARNEYEEEASVESSHATSWCAIGCAARATWDLGILYADGEFEEFMNYWCNDEFGINNVVNFNDREETTFEDVRLFVKCLKDKDVDIVGPEHDCTCDACTSNA